MDYQKIKSNAKEKIKGNLGILWQALGLIVIGNVMLEVIFQIMTPESILATYVNLILSILILPLSFGVNAYFLKFVRKEEATFQIIFNYYKKIIPIFLLSMLVSIFTILWSFLFIIPGVIAAISYTMSTFIFIDGEDDAINCISKSKKMMNGYKANYFMFCLSFVGWFLLGALTLGILYIWVLPYFYTSNVLYYEEIKKINQSNN